MFVPDGERDVSGFSEDPGTTVHVIGLTDMLEGEFRSGHFDGVTTVVTKLFSWRAGAAHISARRTTSRWQSFAGWPVTCACRSRWWPVRRCARWTGSRCRVATCGLGQRADRHATVIHRALVAGSDCRYPPGRTGRNEVREIDVRGPRDRTGCGSRVRRGRRRADLTTPGILSGEVRLLIAARSASEADRQRRARGVEVRSRLQLFETDPVTIASGASTSGSIHFWRN